MTVRLVALAVLAAVLWALLNVSITLPALTVVGIVAWAVVSTVLAVLLAVDRRRPSWREHRP